MKPLASVVVPFYNEQDNIEPLYAQIAAVFDSLADYRMECVFVDDGSTDATAAKLAALAEQDSRVHPVYLARNCGQSGALFAGMQAAAGAYILTLDGDLQNDPADIPEFLSLLRFHDCVCGYRAERQDSWVRKLSSRIANAVRNAVLHDGIRDSGCGAKGFRRHCVAHLVPFNGLHRFLAVFMRAQGFSIVEHPVHHHPRHAGVSKYGIHNRLWRGLFDLVGVAWLSRRQLFCSLKDAPTHKANPDHHRHSA